MAKRSVQSADSGHLTSYRFPGNVCGPVFEEVKPDYVLHSFSESVYKIVRFKRAPAGAVSLAKLDKSQQECNDSKLANNLSRARSMLLQYALCNPWDYFFTGTLNEQFYDRNNLDVYYTALSQWIRDKRKEYGSTIQYLLVPEHHKDGAWHIHGLIYGLSHEQLSHFIPGIHPVYLVKHGFLNWTDYAKKFGFCSLGRIRDPVATALYVVKYLNKDTGGRSGDLGKHLYFHSRPLKTSVPIACAYGSQPDLDQYIQHEYDFCSTGMVFGKDWTFPCEGDLDIPQLERHDLEELPAAICLSDMTLPEWEQMKITMEEFL